MRTAKGSVKLYFCIDTIMDTRLATLASIDDDYAFAALLGGYMDRWTDDPATYAPVCGTDVFFEAYAKRNKGTLKLAYPTDHALDAGKIIEDLEVRHGAGDPTVANLPVIYVNYYHYDLTPAEVVEYTKAIRAIFKCRSQIKMFSRPVEKLTLNYFKENDYVGVYIYGYREWIESVITKPMNDGEVIDACPEITFFFPAVVGRASAQEVYAECERALGTTPDAFANVKLHCAKYIGIDWVSPTYYSISPSILFPEEEQKKAEVAAEAPLDKAFLFNKNDPADLARLYSIPDSEP